MIKEYPAGDGVTVSFDDETGEARMISDNGTLWPDWPERTGIGRNRIELIRVISGTVYLQNNTKDTGVGIFGDYVNNP